MPRIVIDDPYARGAVWTRRCGLIGAALALSAVVMAHHGTDDYRLVLAVLAAGLGFAIWAGLCAPWGAGEIWRHGYKGTGRLVAGLALAAATLAYPAALIATWGRAWDTRDVATDERDPPRLSTSARALRVRGPMAPATMPRLADLSSGLGEALTPEQSTTESFASALAVVKRLRWTVIEAVPPVGAGEGHIDAVARSLILRFPDDIAIRIRRTGEGSRIDIRSIARLPIPSLGDDARNVRDFVDQVTEDLDSE